MIDKKLMSKLIEIGQKEDFDALNRLFLPGEVEEKGSTMRQGFKAWYDLADTLAEEEIAALIKTFTIAEKVLKGWKAGSISPVIWLGIKLKERKFNGLDEIRRWVKEHGDHNSWLTQRW